MVNSITETRRIPPDVASYPAVPAALLFLLGIAGYSKFPVWPVCWLVILVLIVAAAFVLRRRALLATLCLVLAWGIAGLLASQLAAYQYPTDQIGLYASDESRLAQLELSLDDPPRVLTNPFDQRRAVPPKQVAIARVVRVRTIGGWRAASGEVLLQIGEPNPQLAAGQIVRATGLLQRPAPAMNPGQFDWAAYYRERRVLASFTVNHAVSLTVLSDDGPNLLTSAQLKARSLLAEGFPAENALDHALLRALLLGDNDPQLRDVQVQFQRTGTAHHLAISGTHIALLGGIVWGLCRLLSIRPRLSAWIALAFIVGYGLLALPSPPVVRSVVLASAMGMGIIAGRQGKALQLLSASVVAMLLYHPPDLFNAGFQLSFGTVMGLILLSRPALHALEALLRRHDPDEIVRRSFETPTRLTGTVRWCDRWCFHTLATGLVAWLVSMPLIAWHFEQLNPWSILAGIVLAPFVFMALVAGMLKVVLTLLWPALAGFWAWLALYPVGWMRSIVEKLSHWPYADVPVPPSPWWLIALFYGLLLMGLIRSLPNSARWILRGARLVAVLFIVLPPLQATLGGTMPKGTARVTLLSIGAGQCAVLQPPGGRTVLLDAGSLTLADPVGKCLGPFLRHSRVADIDTIVLSHGDYDHVSAAVEVVKSYGVREVLTGARFVEHGGAGDATRKLVADLERLERPPRIVLPDQRTPFGRETAIEILWPPAPSTTESAKSSSNDGCLVFRLKHAGKTILFPGDIQDGAMRELLKSPKKLKADVLVAMHHGSAESLSAAFIDAVDPAYIISSNDRTLTGKQRAFDRLVAGRTFLRTNESGAITVTIDARGNLSVDPFLAKK